MALPVLLATHSRFVALPVLLATLASALAARSPTLASYWHASLSAQPARVTGNLNLRAEAQV